MTTMIDMMEGIGMIMTDHHQPVSIDPVPTIDRRPSQMVMETKMPTTTQANQKDKQRNEQISQSVN